MTFSIPGPGSLAMVLSSFLWLMASQTFSLASSWTSAMLPPTQSLPYYLLLGKINIIKTSVLHQKTLPRPAKKFSTKATFDTNNWKGGSQKNIICE
jgi:hypothetical protein